MSGVDRAEAALAEDESPMRRWVWGRWEEVSIFNYQVVEAAEEVSDVK